MKFVFFFGDKALTSIEYMFCRWSEALVAKGNRVEIVIPHQIEMGAYLNGQIKIRRSFGNAKIMVQGDVFFAATEEGMQRCRELPGPSFLVWNQYSLPRESYDGRIVCFSKRVKDYFMAQHGKEIHYIPPAPDWRIFDHFSLEEEELPGINLLFWGDEGSRDDLHITLAALDLIKSSLPKLKLYVLGTSLPEGMAFQAVEELICPADLNKRLDLLEGVRIVLWSRRADVAVLNVAALEVISANKPLVCFTCQGIEDFAQPEENCLLIEPANNVKQVAMDILRILRIGQLRNSIIANGRRYIKELEAGFGSKEINDLALRYLDLQGKKKEPAAPVAKEGQVDLVIAGCDNLKRLKKCVAKLKEYTPQPYNIIIVDNASKDGCKEYIESLVGVTGIFNQRKIDRTRIFNQGILAGDGEFIVLLSCKVEVGADWLTGMLECARGDDKIALVSPQLDTGDNSILKSYVAELSGICGPREGVDSDGKYDFETVVEVMDISGACCLIKRKLLARLGLFDESCPSSLATIDYALRAGEKGYKVMFCPQFQLQYHDENIADQEIVELPINEAAGDQTYFRDKWSSLAKGKNKRRLVKDILVLGKIPWEYDLQRAQQLLTRFAGKGYNILYVNPYCSPAGLSRITPKLHTFSIPGKGTAKLNMQYVDNRGNMVRSIKKMLANLAMNYPILWVGAPFWQPLIKYFEHSVLIYDRPKAFSGSDNWSEHCLWAAEDAALLEDANCVLGSAENSLEVGQKDVNGEEFVETDRNSLENQPESSAREFEKILKESVREEDWGRQVEAIEELFYASYGEKYQPLSDCREAGTPENEKGVSPEAGIASKEEEKEYFCCQPFFRRCCSWLKSLFKGI